MDREKLKQTKLDYKIIFKRPSGQQPTTFSKTKIQKFLSNYKSSLKKFIFLGWVKRIYPIYEAGEFIKMSTKKEMRFMVSTSETRSEVRKIHKKSNEFGINIWDIT